MNNKEKIKRIIHEKIMCKNFIESIAKLQIDYDIGFPLAREIYFENNLNYAKKYFEEKKRFEFIDYWAVYGGIIGVESYIWQLEKIITEKKRRYPNTKIRWRESYMIETLQMVIKTLESGCLISKPDMYKSSVDKIVVDYERGTLLLPLQSIPGITENIANLIVTEREKKKFNSIEDFRRRINVKLQTLHKIDQYKMFANRNY